MKKIFGHGGNIVLLMFGVAVVTLTVVFFWINSHRLDLVTDNYYEKEMNYQQHLQAVSNTKPIMDSIRLERLQDQVMISLPKNLSAQMDSGSVNFYCPENMEYDVVYKLAPTADGQYIFPTAKLKGKFYKPEVSFSVQGKQFYKKSSLFL